MKRIQAVDFLRGLGVFLSSSYIPLSTILTGFMMLTWLTQVSSLRSLVFY